MTRTAEPSPATRVVDAQFVAAAPNEAALPAPTLVEVGFAGRSNVGKSSLLNTLMQRRALARTSHTPGCTRQLNLYDVRLADGLALKLVDLPGYGWARRSKGERQEWQEMVEGYLERRTALRALVLLVDSRRGPEDEERQLVTFLRKPAQTQRATPLPVVLVATKVDKLGASAKKPALESLRRAAAAIDVQDGVISFSAVTGEGREELWNAIRRAVL